MRGAIDIGNTRCKAGLFDNTGSLLEVKIFDTPSSAAEWLELRSATDIIISDVKGLASFTSPGLQIQYAGAHLKLPFTNAYGTPETLGADRIAVMAAVACMFPGQASLVFDIGTCMTIDLMHPGNIYKGGNISPGLQMRLRAMHEFTGKLPLAAMELNNFEYGKDTSGALANGAALGMLYEIEGYIENVLNQYTDVHILLCGGDAPYFEKRLKYKIFADQDLVLHGLYHLSAFNDKNS